MANEEKRPLKVFLCHASGDKPPVRELYKRLVTEGVDAWLDQEKLLPGQDWRLEIPKAVQESDVVVICLSKKSITKEGYVQKEIKFALDKAKEKPEGTIFLIPARLEECEVPSQLELWQWVDLYEENGFIKLLRSLKLRANAVGAVIGSITYEDTEKELKHRLEQLYTEGLAAFYTEDWDKACYRFQTILSEQPNYKKATEKLAEAECQRDLARLYLQATEAYQSENWQVAIEALEQLSRKSADYKDTAQLLRDARRQKQLRELYAEASALHAGQKWQAVVKVFKQISVIEPNYPDADGLLVSAQKEVAELEWLAKLDEQYNHALREMESGNWYGAHELLESIHKSRTGFLETEKLLRKVENEISREEEKRKQNDQINMLYEQAHGLQRTKKWRNALDKLEQIRKLDQHFPDTEGIAEKAQKELEREEQETDRQNKLAALYAEAVRLLKEEKYQEALDKWQKVKAIDPKYPDHQWVQKTVMRKLADARKPVAVQNDLRTILGRLFLNKDVVPSTEIASSIDAQTRAGWLILFVAVSWGIGRFAIEFIGRITGFFGLGANFWSAEIIVGVFGLLYGMAIWPMLHLLKIVIGQKKAAMLTAGWLLGFLSVPIIGFSFSGIIGNSWDIGYILAGLISGLCTALVLRSIGLLSAVRQVFIITIGMALSIYLGEKFIGILGVVLTQDMYSVSASYQYGLGSFVAGLVSAWILVSQLSRRDEPADFAKQEWSILFVMAGWFAARFITTLIEVKLYPNAALKSIITLLINGALNGSILWAGIQLATQRLTKKHLFQLTSIWAGGMTLAGVIATILGPNEMWIWMIALGISSALAAWISGICLKPLQMIGDKKHLIALSVSFGLGFVVGMKWMGGEILGGNLISSDLSLCLTVALQSGLAGFLGMTVLLGGNVDFSRNSQVNWKFGLGGLLGFLIGDLVYVLFFRGYGQSTMTLAGFALAGLVLGFCLMISTKNWRTILLIGIVGACAYASAIIFWWNVSKSLKVESLVLYLIFGVFWGMGLSVGHRRLSAILLFCSAGFTSLLIQHFILSNQLEGTVLYWIGYFLRDMVLGGLIGLAWAYFLHPKPGFNEGQISLIEHS